MHRVERRGIVTGVLLMAFASGLAWAQTAPTPLLEHTFDTSENGWTAAGKTAKVSVTTEASEVKQGKGALKFEYGINKDEMNIAALSDIGGALDKMQSLRFWIKSDYTAPIVVALQEKNGGRYVAVFTAPGSQWQRVELAPSDFTLSAEANDPKDPDGKLDLDQVESVSIMDLSQLFVQNDNPVFVKLLHVQTGPHVLLLDDFVVNADPLPEAAPGANGNITFDKFTRPQTNWLAIGQAKLTQMQGKPLEGMGLQVDYHQAPQTLMGLARAVSGKKLVGATHLHFSAASTRAVKLIVQLEEIGGGKYNAMVDVPEGAVRTELDLALSDFKPADDSQDADGKLDLDQVKQLIVVDITGFSASDDQANTLWLNNVRATGDK